MAEIKNGDCSCYDCSKKRQNEQRHLQHPFYKKVEDVTAEVAKEQILKGAAKYPEPFNPDSWTNKELATHLLQELRDGQVYGVGLLDRLEKQEIEFEKAYNNLLKDLEQYKSRCKDYEIKINKYDQELNFARQEAEHWRLRTLKEKEQNGTTTIFNDIKKALGENLDVQG